MSAVITNMRNTMPADHTGPGRTSDSMHIAREQHARRTGMQLSTMIDKEITNLAIKVPTIGDDEERKAVLQNLVIIESAAEWRKNPMLTPEQMMWNTVFRIASVLTDLGDLRKIALKAKGPTTGHSRTALEVGANTAGLNATITEMKSIRELFVGDEAEVRRQAEALRESWWGRNARWGLSADSLREQYLPIGLAIDKTRVEIDKLTTRDEPNQDMYQNQRRELNE